MRAPRNPLCIACVVPLLGLTLAMPAGVLAADAKKDNKEQAQRQQQMQQLKQKLSALEQEKTQLEGKLKDASGQLEKSNAGAALLRRKASEKQATLEGDLKASREENLGLSSRLESTRVELDATRTKLAETQEHLRQTVDKAKQLETNLKARGEALTSCESKNDSLYRTGGELIKRYEEKGCFTTLIEAEPFTRLGAISNENKVEEFRQQLEQDRANQQAEAARAERQRKANADRLAVEKAEAEMAEKRRIEREKLARLKKREQSDIDRLSRRVMNLFGDIEW